MSEKEKFILKAEQFNQEEWCEMFRRVSEDCKDLRNENDFLQTQLQQKENIIKEVREEIKILESNCDISDYHAQKLYQTLDKENKQ